MMCVQFGIVAIWDTATVNTICAFRRSTLHYTLFWLDGTGKKKSAYFAFSLQGSSIYYIWSELRNQIERKLS